MAVSIPDLCNDLAAETSVLAAVIDDLTDEGWSTVTPAEGWTIKDEIAHLAYFDTAVATAVRDPQQFVADRDEMMRKPAFVDTITSANRSRSGVETNEWFRSARASMVAAFEAADPSIRVPWYGPEMSLASAVTARIMETWAHGQDVFDALGVRHPRTSALQHVAHIGVRTLPNSFTSRGFDVPNELFRVELHTPEGHVFVWGRDDADQRVTGSAEEFCLVVTQRRHVDDTRLIAEGEVAEQWLSIAQAFAGPPGSGRRSGQFPPLTDAF